MKKISVLIMGAFLLTLGATAEDSENSKTVFKVEKNKSKVLWTGKKVTGEHTGTVLPGDGEIVLEGDKIVNASVKMDMTSITCTDLTDEQWNQKLVGHLKSDDFFSVEKHPESVFLASGFVPVSGAKKGENNYTVTGKLTIKGISNEIEFPARIDVAIGQLNALGVATIDRTKWDIKYGSGSFFKGLGDNMISDNFKITFELQAKADVSN